MSIEVVTYHSTNAKPSEAWLAYVENNGVRWMVQFAAASEEAAKAKALALWESERAKLYKPAAPETNRDASKPVGGGRGSHFVGKAWLINSATREKIRVPVEDVSRYLSQGWERGGPRSK